jgi:hypothetical protein
MGTHVEQSCTASQVALGELLPTWRRVGACSTGRDEAGDRHPFLQEIQPRRGLSPKQADMPTPRRLQVTEPDQE